MSSRLPTIYSHATTKKDSKQPAEQSEKGNRYGSFFQGLFVQCSFG